jgi:hypothetical protein
MRFHCVSKNPPNWFRANSMIDKWLIIFALEPSLVSYEAASWHVIPCEYCPHGWSTWCWSAVCL